MDTQETKIEGKVESVVDKNYTGALLDVNVEVSDCEEVDAALDEAMGLEDEGVNNAIEETSETNVLGVSNEKSNEGENKKVSGLAGDAAKLSVDTPGGAVTVQIPDKRNEETDKLEDKNADEDKTALQAEDMPGIQTEKLGETQEVVKTDFDLGKPIPVIAKITAPEEIVESQEETKILSAPVQKEKEVEVTDKQKDIGIKSAVETLGSAADSAIENQQVKEELNDNIEKTLPTTAVTEEKGTLIENSEGSKGAVKLIKVAAPKVPPPKVPPPQVPPPQVPSTSNQTLKVDTAEPGGKPCDRITKDMVPTMKEGPIEEVLKLSGQIEFLKGVTPLALLSKSRWLVLQADVTLVPQVPKLFSFLGSFRRTTYHLFLFNDVLLICKNKRGSKFVALNYCQRNLVLIKKASSVESLQEKVRNDTPGKSKVFLTLLENHEKKAENMVLSFSDCGARDDWIKSFRTPASTTQQEVIYEMWDRPLVKISKDFEATKPEEMTVHKDEKCYVTRKSANGFYEGERISDQARGYFPISVAEELASEHSRAQKIRTTHNNTTF